MEWKWQCKFCQKLIDDADALLRHVFTEHREAVLYANPLPVDKWNVTREKEEIKTQPKFQVPKAVKKQEEKEDDDEEDYESLNI